MKLLLDSHVLLWWSDTVPGRLSAQARRSIDGADAIFVSTATVWELEIKVQSGRLGLDRIDWDVLPQQSVVMIPIERSDALAAARLPLCIAIRSTG